MDIFMLFYNYCLVAAILKKFREQYVEGLVSRKKDLMENLHEVIRDIV